MNKYQILVLGGLLLLWYLLSFFGHEDFSNHIYAPLRELTGHVAMEYICAIGIGFIMLFMVFAIRRTAYLESKLEWGRWLLIVVLILISSSTLMVTNIEIIHFFQYAALLVLLRLCGLAELSAYIFAFLTSLCDEGRQYFLFPRFTGYFDWNDIFINNIGIVLGILMVRKAATKRSHFARAITATCVVTGLCILVWLLSYIFTGTLLLNAPLSPGSTPTAFPLIDGVQYMALSLKEATQPFWQELARGRMYHMFGVIEGFVFCAVAAYLLWKLVHIPTHRPHGEKRVFSLLIGCSVFVSLALLSNSPAIAQGVPHSYPHENATPVLTATQRQGALLIDGQLNDEAWQGAHWTQDYKDLVDDTPHWLHTESAFLWDDTHLYLAMRLQEPWLEAKIFDRDGPVYRDPDMEIFIAGKNAYWELEVNAAGTIYDVFWIWRDALHPHSFFTPQMWQENKRRVLLLSGIAEHRHPRGERLGFIDANLQDLQVAVTTQGTLNNNNDIDEGWCIEIAIPWASIAHIHEDTTWHATADARVPINVFRFVNRDSKGSLLPTLRPAAWALAQHSVFDAHMPEKFGWLYLR